MRNDAQNMRNYEGGLKPAARLRWSIWNHRLIIFALDLHELPFIALHSTHKASYVSLARYVFRIVTDFHPYTIPIQWAAHTTAVPTSGNNITSTSQPISWNETVDELTSFTYLLPQTKKYVTERKTVAVMWNIWFFEKRKKNLFYSWENFKQGKLIDSIFFLCIN